MTERRLLRLAILAFWTLFWGLSVTDKIIPDVQYLWVGKDFFALFIKFFASLGLKDPLFATGALAAVSALEAVNFGLYLAAFISFWKGDDAVTNRWFFRAILTSMTLFSLFSIADQVFGDRFQLLEHGLFWLILLASWLVFRHAPLPAEEAPSSALLPETRRLVLAGCVMTVAIATGLMRFSSQTVHQAVTPVTGEEVVDGLYKFDFPFLADKVVWENTVNAFMAEHPDLKVRYIYTGPSELNTKKKTHLLLYVFTEPL